MQMNAASNKAASNKAVSNRAVSKISVSTDAVSKDAVQVPRRRFLKTALSAAGAAVMAPTIIPSSALGRDGAVAPSERIVLGGIGIGNRGTYDLGCFLEQKD